MPLGNPEGTGMLPAKVSCARLKQVPKPPEHGAASSVNPTSPQEKFQCPRPSPT